LQLSFKRESNADKVLKKQLDAHYRTLSQDVDDFISRKAQNHFPELFKIIQDKKTAIAVVVAVISLKLDIPFLDFLSSHIHMMVNR
jgi:hypothetical protein